MMTEGEAKTKVCVQALTCSTPHSAWMCIASACMAWRWEYASETQVDVQKHWARWRFVDPFDPLKAGEWPTDLGYCGLAGKP